MNQRNVAAIEAVLAKLDQYRNRPGDARLLAVFLANHMLVPSAMTESQCSYLDIQDFCDYTQSPPLVLPVGEGRRRLLERIARGESA